MQEKLRGAPAHAASPPADASANAAQGQPAATPAPDASDLTADHGLAAVNNSLTTVNARFNAALARQIAGTLPPGYVYQLGRPGRILLSAGIPDLPIEMRASRLALKSSVKYKNHHPFKLEDIVDLPIAIAFPIAVFESNTQYGSKVIFTELKDRKGNSFIVSINTNVPRGYRLVQVNSISSVYPKDDIRGIIHWINRGDRLKYADKNKFLTWIVQQRPHATDLSIQNQELDIATKIVQSFVNPKSVSPNVD